MGMFDNVKCEWPIEEPVQNEVFQTKSFGDGYVGGFMDDYTITKEGRLIHHKTTYEVVPEEERPYWGKPEWKKNPLMQVCGSMRAVHVEDVDTDYHGDVVIYTIIGNTWHEYKFRFTDGKVTNVDQVFREFGNDGKDS